jgi:hypothetical protein
MKLIYRAGDITEAHIVSGLLNANGIESHVGGHYLQGGVGDLSAIDFATIHVADENIFLARSIIKEYEDKQNRPRKKINIKQATLTSTLIITIMAFLLIILISYLVLS